MTLEVSKSGEEEGAGSWTKQINNSWSIYFEAGSHNHPGSKPEVDVRNHYKSRSNPEIIGSS